MTAGIEASSSDNSRSINRAVRAEALGCGGALVALALLLVGNYLFAAHYLLRLEPFKGPFASIDRHLAPISKPVVFTMERNRRDDTAWGVEDSPQELFLAAMGQTSGSLPETSDHLIPIDQVVRTNPYPQPLAVVYGNRPSYMTFGYVGTDRKYHQVTHYWGESDTTPSFLTRKVRGEATRWGDHYIRYTVFLSKSLEPRPVTYSMKTGEITGWDGPPAYPDLDHVDWSTYRGPTYDGLEEILFAVGATCLEALAIGIWWRIRRRQTTRGAT